MFDLGVLYQDPEKEKAKALTIKRRKKHLQTCAKNRKNRK